MFKLLSIKNSLSSGSDLWIASHPDSCKIAKRLEWHMAFIHSKFKPKSELLAESSLYVPNRHTLFLPLENSTESWIQKAYLHWTKLKKPRLRLFLTHHISLDILKRYWPIEVLPYNIEVCIIK